MTKTANIFRSRVDLDIKCILFINYHLCLCVQEDIEQMIAEFVEKDKRLTQVIEEKCSPPSPR